MENKKTSEEFHVLTADELPKHPMYAEPPKDLIEVNKHD